MSVHHFLNLEHIFSEVKKTLKRGGVFFLNEFIGPSQFQWTDRQLEIVNGLLHTLPKKYKIMNNNTLKVEVQRPSISQMNAVDPSEAIRSGEIVDILSSFFRIIKKSDYGGTILHLLLEGIAFNFDINNKEDIRLLNLLFDVEDCLLELGDITNDFSVIIAQV
jgi:SAM-dependent methyltransferase